jgi:hypothetical protein
MSEETKPEMTAEEFIEIYLSHRMDKPQITSDLLSVIRGELMNFRDCHNRTHFMIIDIDEIDEFLNNNQ